jgi:hypothetical protein
MRRRPITRAAVALLMLAAALATGSGPVGPRAIPAHAQRLADGKVMTIRMSTAARVFDLSPTGRGVLQAG